MSEYRLDKNYFKAQSFEEAERDNVFDKSVPVNERLRQAYFLILHAYNFNYDDLPKMDRTAFSMRKLN